MSFALLRAQVLFFSLTTQWHVNCVFVSQWHSSNLLTLHKRNYYNDKRAWFEILPLPASAVSPLLFIVCSTVPIILPVEIKCRKKEYTVPVSFQNQDLHMAERRKKEQGEIAGKTNMCGKERSERTRKKERG